MKDYSAFYAARDIVSEILRQDFIGPVIKDETLTELPLQYYLMGKLYPKEDITEELDMARNPFLENAAESYDSSISLSNQKNPSSMGITFTVMPGVDRFVVKGSFAVYEPIPFANAIELGIELPEYEDNEKKPKYVWNRVQYDYREVIKLDRESIAEISLPRRAKIKVYINKEFEDSGEKVITVALINDNSAESSDLTEINAQAMFQPVIEVSGENGLPIFTTVERKVNLTTDPELLELDMLYRDTHCYGQGHGCAVVWDLDNEEPLWVRSEFFPFYNLRQMKPSSKASRVFNMKRLFTEPATTIVAELRAFMSDYKVWIDGLRESIKGFDEIKRHSAEINIQKCEKALSTINRTIDALEKDAKTDGPVFRAFRLANEAMYMQRERALIRKKAPVNNDDINWYPFQLAFLLQEMISFIDPNGPERENVDLLWFPTGGGKTEAYLGISAFVIFLRRLRNVNDNGVTIIMRYTLRLLTLQQFERASMLIFACEKLRREKRLGGSEISIGLWVGGKLTPNKLAAAKSSIAKLQNGGVLSGDDENPFQIKICPWCGEPLTINDYSVDDIHKRMIIRCHNHECYYHSSAAGLPFHIIDESIYEYLPTFIIATVDKFAQMPLSDKPASLFGITSGKNPPSLIIQDELHLISGPLGTMTGIYEAAITNICKKDGISAKVIASTATIRNATNQIMALYGRPFTQFPPQGISTADSFFAEASEETEKPARKYFGVMGIGTTATTTLIRVNAALLFATRYLEKCNTPAKVIDGYWTIIEYFNSLRELGGASTQILDDVQSRFGYLAKTKFAKVYPGVDADKAYDYNVELTSRMNNEDITKVIQVGLQNEYPSPDAYDFVLASNMIQVGVDVGRLGAMVVAGQPKTNAEYIQATSRVGRENPGLVITVYNASRSRDRSHYEQFLKYHSALYRYVESTSLTPFSDRARDRGLHALFVAMCRYLVGGLLNDGDAIHFHADDPRVQAIKKTILDYVSVVDHSEYDAVSRELDEICEDWEDKAIGSLNYKWGAKNLLKQDIEEDRFRTMNSMRNVDAQSGVWLMGRS